MIRVVSIKFRTAGKLYDFDARDFELNTGAKVVVETDRGRALGSVVIAPRQISKKQVPDSIKAVIRLASPKDLESEYNYSLREQEAYRYCQQRILERNMDMKLVRAEYLFDGSKIIFYFTADGRVDFRELVKDLAHHFHTRIEMRQIGVRDEAKLTGGLGICGRELCCCTFLRDFQPVSVKMAKEQGLALNPSKISGQCGRLLCCLGYEFETYCALRKKLPKCGKKLPYEGQNVEVVNQDILAQKVKVRTEDNTLLELSLDDLKNKGNTPQASGGQDKEPPRSRKPRGSRPAKPQAKAAPESPKEQPASSQAKSASKDEGEKKKSRRRRRRPRKRGGTGGTQGPSPGNDPGKKSP